MLLDNPNVTNENGNITEFHFRTLAYSLYMKIEHKASTSSEWRLTLLINQEARVIQLKTWDKDHCDPFLQPQPTMSRDPCTRHRILTWIVITPSLPTFSIALAINSPISLSPFEEIVPTYLDINCKKISVLAREKYRRQTLLHTQALWFVPHHLQFSLLFSRSWGGRWGEEIGKV